MPAMSTGASLGAKAESEKTGLPEINYMPPVVFTLAAAVLLFLTMLGLSFFGVLNTYTQFNRASRHELGGSAAGGTLCGILTVLALVGVIYFFMAVMKGFRDMGSALYFTRGVVVAKPGVQGRSTKNWLVVQPEYAGPDVYAASAISDEQRAASVDRSRIFNPRFSPSQEQRSHAADDEALRQKIDSPARATGSYLSPSRISANQAMAEPGSNGLPGARAVFRIDFANKAAFSADEEVLVAHSRFLQHIYYVARLRNGEWEAVRNKSLI